MSLLSGQTDSKDESSDAKNFKHAEARDARLKDRDQQEVEKLRVWKEADHRRKAALEDGRISREEALEYAKEVAAQVKLEKRETWDRLEQVRDEKIRHKDNVRLLEVQERYSVRPLG